MRTPGIIGLSGKCPGKKLSLKVTFLIPTAETPGLYSITLSTKTNGNLQMIENVLLSSIGVSSFELSLEVDEQLARELLLLVFNWVDMRGDLETRRSEHRLKEERSTSRSRGRSSDIGFGALWANYKPSGRLASPAVPLDGSEF
ncbi:hypothetical protein L2E82_45721 [Cichorium intybus]|uniref:Uncharacterized protein n=1 Tax=Cichorium intybus TaxID=13427 RepID=A0ACB8ZU29_CICIN|nr:hypothetical protein L2E82_45721 [Cichorium intybus]